MVNTLQKAYNRTPWQQKRLSKPVDDPNYVTSPLALQSPAFEGRQLEEGNEDDEDQQRQSQRLQRQISYAEPHRTNTNRNNNNSTADKNTNSNNNNSGNGGKDNSDAATQSPPRKGITRADTKISLRKSRKDSRRVFINTPVTDQYLDKSNGLPKTTFGSNRINTAKYTTLTFLPKNLFEQFRRVANMFFLFMAIIQLTPTFTVGSPFLTVFPLSFVIGVTAIKDGFEDYKRHVEDRNFNQRLCQQLKNVDNYNYGTAEDQKQGNIFFTMWKRLGLSKSKAAPPQMSRADVDSLAPVDDDLNHTTQPQQKPSDGSTTPAGQAGPQPEFVKEQWHNLRVGDFIMLKNNQAVPADAIILSTSESEGSCFIETKDLDGETNLKTRVSLHETSKYNTARRCSRLQCYIDMEPINANLFSFNGSLTMLAKRRSAGTQDAGRGKGVAGQSGNQNRYSVYAASVTSSMMTSVRGSMEDNHDSMEQERIESPMEGSGGVSEDGPAQSGTSASDYARLHKSQSHRRRSRFSESVDSPLTSSPVPESESNNQDDKQEYEEPTELMDSDDVQQQHREHPGVASSSLRPTISKRSSLHRSTTGISTNGASEMAKGVLKANHEQQMQQQQGQGHQLQDSQTAAAIRRERSSVGNKYAHGKPDGAAATSAGGHGQYKETTIPVDINNVLLRGHVIRNTHWVIAVIVATGTETKIMLNSGETPSKRSRIEKTMNIQVALNFGILLLLCIVCAVGSSIYDRQWRHTTAEELWDGSTRGVVIEGVITFFTSLIIFQNIIPISLYISIEFVKTFQAYFIWQDSDMYDVELDQFCTPKTWNLTDDLGQIEYVFSDKTGTLTRNIMEFKKCSINGKIYGNNAVSGQTDAEKGLQLMNNGQDPSGHDDSGETGHGQSSRQQQQQPNDRNQGGRGEKDSVLKEYDQEIRKLFEPTYMDPLENLTFADPDLLRDMNGQGSAASESRSTTTAATAHSGNGEGSSTSNQPMAHHSGGHPGQEHDGSPATNIRDFFTLLALCHTVVVEQPEEEIKDDDDDDFGTYDDNNGSPKSGVEDGRGGSNVEQAKEQKGGLHLGLRDKLKQKVEAAGLSVPGATSSAEQGSGPGTRSRKNSNSGSVSPMKSASKENLGQHHGNEPSASMDDQGKPKPTLQYRAESPDEAALVSAAKNVGFVFVSRGAVSAESTEGDKAGKSGAASGSNSRQNVNVNFLGQDHTYEQLDVIKFNSTRKRMTVIVREPQELGGKILLLTKGADNVIFERLTHEGDESVRDQTEQDIEAFSNMGLRTLTLAQRVLDQQTYDAWSTKYAEAGKALDDRAKKLDEVAEEIEKDLTLIGATAIEDKLQEGVPESIAALREAGIKVWVLTGDKLETAINIGFASRLLEKDMKLEIMKMGRNEDPNQVLKRFKELVEGVMSGKGSKEEQSGAEFTSTAVQGEQRLENEKVSSSPTSQQQQHGQEQQQSPPPVQPHSISNGNSWDEKHLPTTPSDTSLLHDPNQMNAPEQQEHQHALIVDGSALKILLDDQVARKDLIRLSDICFSVICCRASPLQKALVVELIRRGKKTVCLAIGDGANDVSMIQAANIGVGIAGQEGMQAAMASDYSITQFRFIRKLVLVHGHWGYMRISEMILNFFFKNVLWVAAVLWFQIYCGFSAMLFYDYTFVSLYNLMLTAVPVLVLGATDQDLIAPYILRYPGVYKLGIHQKRYNQFRFVVYMLDGVWQSLVVFFFWRGVYDTNILSQSGLDASLIELSTSVAITNVVIASLYVGLHTYHWTWLMHFAVWGSMTFLVLLVLIYGAFTASPIYHIGIRLFSEGPFWFMLVLAVISAFLVRYTVLFVSFWWLPDDVHAVRGIMIAEKQAAIKQGKKWTGVGEGGVEKVEQSEQEKAILKKEDEAKKIKDQEKAEKNARKHGHGFGGKGRQEDGEQPYDLTMIQINVNDHSQLPSASSTAGPRQGTTLASAQDLSRPQTPLEIQQRLLEAQKQQQERLAVEQVKPNDPGFQHNRRTSSYNYVGGFQGKPAALPPVPSPSLLGTNSAASSNTSLHAPVAVHPPVAGGHLSPQHHQVPHPIIITGGGAE